MTDSLALLPGSTFVSSHDLILAENVRSVPTFLSRLSELSCLLQWTHRPQFHSRNIQFYYFWKACLKSRKILCDTSWAVAAEQSFYVRAKNKVSIFFLGVGERSSYKALFSENVHTGVSLSCPQGLITDPPVGLWVAVLRSQEYSVTAALQHASLRNPSGPGSLCAT